MKKTVLIYGTWKNREYIETAKLFEAHNVPYEESAMSGSFPWKTAQRKSGASVS